MANKTISGTAVIDSVRLEEQASDPSTPASGYWQLYVKSGGVYAINDAGTVIGPFTATGSAHTEGCRVYHDANQSISNTTDTALSFNSEDYDTDTMHDNASNNSRITIQTAGKYILVANIEWEEDADGVRNLFFKLNGSTDIGRVLDNPGASNGTLRQNLVTIYDLSVSDYVECWVWHSAGAALNVEYVAERSANFMAQRIG